MRSLPNLEEEAGKLVNGSEAKVRGGYSISREFEGSRKIAVVTQC